MRRIFGTDGIRGIANVDPMTTEMMVKVGRAAAHIFKEQGEGRHRIVIGKDTRLSGYMLENALASGICSMGVDVLLVGPLPTPGIAFITAGMRADAGVVISASHNPFQDNGIKFFSRDGYKLPDEVEEDIERHVFGDMIEDLRPTATEVGKAFRIDDSVGRYIVYLKSKFPKGLTLEGLTIAVDCANGAAYRVAPAVFEELGAKVISVAVEPDGENINDGCGSLYPEKLAEVVVLEGADIGIALDGDADRLILVDAKGEIVDGDHTMAICALALKERDELAKDTLVATVMSNMGLEIAMRENGIKLERTDVGDRYVVGRMREGGFNLGGEQSGHLVFLDHATTGDGILAALMVLSGMVQSSKTLAEFASVMEALPQTLKNVMVREKLPLEKLPGVSAAIRDAEAQLGSRGRVLVRYSGTEAKLRVMMEGDRLGEIESLTDKVADAVVEEIGA